MIRHRSLAALSLAVAALVPSIVRAQVLADRVPADALVYVGWAGADELAAKAKGTRLDALLAESKARELYGNYLDQVEAMTVKSQPQAREGFRVMRALAGPMWRSRTVVFGARPASLDDPKPRVALMTRCGPAEAQRIVAEVQALIARGGAEAEKLQLKTSVVGDVAVVSIGYDDPADFLAGGQSLVADKSFMDGARRTTVPTPAVIFSLNTTAAVALANEAIAKQQPESAAKTKAFLEAAGLSGVRRYTRTSGFDGKEWATQTFLDAPAPRTGLLAGATGPIDPALLKAVPADATYFSSFRADLAGVVRTLQTSLGKADPEAQKMFNMGIGAIHQAIGTAPVTNILDPLGSDWAAYASPTVGSTSILGTVLVNKPDDATKLRRNLVTASVNLTNWINIAVDKSGNGGGGGGGGPEVRIHGASTKIGDVEVFYVATPFFAPSWAIHDGRLYLGLYPQVVGAAARTAARGGPSLVEGEKYRAAVARLGVNAPGATGYIDLPGVVGRGSWYPQLLFLARYAGFGDLFGLTLPEPLLPPLDVIAANLTPAATASWSDEAGYYTKQVVPFPGATAFSEQGAVVAGGGGGAALGASILLPSLNRARETANRVKSASNLKQIGMAMLLHSNEHRNRYPDDFAALLDQDLVPDVFVSPRTQTEMPPEIRGDAAAAKAWIVANGDYVYLGKGKTNSVTAETIIAYEKPDGLEDGINVLYGDGHVEFQQFADGILDTIATQEQAAAPDAPKQNKDLNN